jgi:hypothetical protein
MWCREEIGNRLSFIALVSVFNIPMPGVGTLFMVPALRIPLLEKKEKSDVVVLGASCMKHHLDSVHHSVFEILHSARKPERAKAILALKGAEPAQAIPILRRALQDSDELVRIFAQNLLSHIVEHVETLTRRLERELSKGRSSAKLVHLAEQYHEQVYLGIVIDQESCRSLIDKAVVLVEEAIQLEPENPRLRLQAVKYLLRNREIERAKVHLWVAEGLAGTSDELLFPLKAEIAYWEKDWDYLHELFEGCPGSSGALLNSIRRFWCEDLNEDAV